jgi:acetoin utilization deacetylase AcuC-like enzyme
VKPDILVVFAGFDAHKDDPLTGLEATEATFTLYGSYIGDLIRREVVRGAVVILGGGYGRGLVSGFRSFIEGLLGIKKPIEIKQESPGKVIEESIPSILSKLEETMRLIKKS